MASVKEEIVDLLDQLTSDQQQQVLNFVRVLQGLLPPGQALPDRNDLLETKSGHSRPTADEDGEHIDWAGWQSF
jgi:hypothetical protein